MHQQLPITKSEEALDEVSYQGKTIKVGDTVLVHHAGQQQEVEVSSILKKNGHYWVGYQADSRFCPWPLVQLP
jgi:hypothetical protein